MTQYNKIISLGLFAVIALAAGYGYFFVFKKAPGGKEAVLSQEEVKAKAEKFISEKLVQPGTEAVITEITEENGLYKIAIDVGGQNATAHITKDGKNFLPQVFNMDAQEDSQNQQQQPQEAAEKTDVPEVELFVMSYCPYGLQIEKGILPVLELLDSKINFSLKFVDYLMHGEKEMDENLRQYCIEQKEPAKLAGYLKCFVGAGDSSSCLKTANISSSLLSGCVSAADAQFKIKEKFENKDLWDNSQFPPFDANKEDNAKYNVAGSPTLVINGATLSVGRDPQGLLNVICSGFSNPPEECNQELSSDAPSPGFGQGTGDNASSSCGN